MPNAPTSKMRRLASGRLADQVTVQSDTPIVPTRAQMAAGASTLGTGVCYDAAVMGDTTSTEAGADVDRVVRDLVVWVDDIDGNIQAGDRMTFTRTRDVSLTGQTGQVLFVDRDSMRAVRRVEVRMANDV